MQDKQAVFACQRLERGLEFARRLCNTRPEVSFINHGLASSESVAMTDIVIVSAARTAVGSFNGAFAAVPAHELGRTAITAALQRAKVDPKEVSEVVLGQVLTANQGMNPARQAARAAGVPDDAPAWSLNQVCGSGLRAVVVGYQQLKAGDAKIVVAGGQESMSPRSGRSRANSRTNSRRSHRTRRARRRRRASSRTKLSLSP